MTAKESFIENAIWSVPLVQVAGLETKKDSLFKTYKLAGYKIYTCADSGIGHLVYRAGDKDVKLTIDKEAKCVFLTTTSGRASDLEIVVKEHLSVDLLQILEVKAPTAETAHKCSYKRSMLFVDSNYKVLFKS